MATVELIDPEAVQDELPLFEPAPAPVTIATPQGPPAGPKPAKRGQKPRVSKKATSGMKAAAEVKAQREPAEGEYSVTDDDVRKAFRRAMDAQRLYLDCETAGLDRRQPLAIGLSFCDGSPWATYIPWGHAGYQQYTGGEDQPQADRQLVERCWQALVKHRDPAKWFFFNKPFDRGMLGATLGAYVPWHPAAYDVHHLCYLANENGSHRLKELAVQHLDPSANEEMLALAPYLKDLSKSGHLCVPPMVEAPYAAEDARLTARLDQRFRPQIWAEGLLGVLRLETELMPVLVAMEDHGILVDLPYVAEQQALTLMEVSDLNARFKELTGYEGSTSSPDQLKVLLYDDWGLKVEKMTMKGEPSTDKWAIERLKFSNPDRREALEVLEQIASLETLLNLFYAPVQSQCDANNSCHTRYNAMVRTGRTSASSPNLQQLPSPRSSDPKDKGRTVRRGFLVRPGKAWLLMDYSQIELRVLAHYCQDPRMRDSYLRDEDLHQATADLMGVNRKLAKTLNFACVPLDTEILTEKGWKKHDEVVIGDRTPGLNLEGKTEWTTVTAVHRYDEAPVTRMTNSHVQLDATDNHRWLGSRRTNGKWHPRVHTTASIAWDDRVLLTAPLQAEASLSITPSEAAIVAWLYTDGSIQRPEVTSRTSQGVDGWKRAFGADIFQAKEAQTRKLDALLAEVPHSRYLRPVRGNQQAIVQWHLSPAYARDLWTRADLDTLGLEGFVRQLGTEQLEAFVEACLDAEGHWNGFSWLFAQRTGEVLEAFQLAAHLAGYRTSRHFKMQYKNTAHWTVSLSKRPLTGQRLARTTLPAQPVWCVTTELGSWTARQGTTPFLTGNSVYGAGLDQLARTMDSTREKAQELRNLYRQVYPGVGHFSQRAMRLAEQRGWVKTISGRRRRLTEKQYRAGNAIIQGSAADIAKLAMVHIAELLATRWPGQAHLIGFVHDEVILEVDQGLEREIFEAVRQVMCAAYTPPLTVPLDVDVATTTTNWGDERDVSAAWKGAE